MIQSVGMSRRNASNDAMLTNGTFSARRRYEFPDLGWLRVLDHCGAGGARERGIQHG